MMSLEINLTGPILEGRAGAMLEEGMRQAAQDVAEWGAEEVRSFEFVMIAPTGTWAGGIDIEYSGLDAEVVPGPVPYNYWLEGTGSRNGRSTFKGYGMWAKSLESTRARTERIVKQALAPFVKRIGG